MRVRPGYAIALGSVLACALIVGIAVLGHKRQAQPPQGEQAPAGQAAADKLPQKARLGLKGLKLEDFDPQGNLVWRVKSSGDMDFDRKGMVARGSNIVWELRRGTQETLTLRAPVFIADYPKGELRFSNGVRVTASTPQVLHFSAAGVVYDLAKQQLVAQGGVDGGLGEYAMKAQRLVAERAGPQVRVAGDVVLTYADYRLTAATVTLDGPTSTATLTGGARLTRGGYVVRSQTMRVKPQAQTVSLQGGVRLSRGEMQGTADSASLDKRASRAELSGGVRLSDPRVTARGQRLTVDGQSSTATLSGGVRCDFKIRF